VGGILALLPGFGRRVVQACLRHAVDIVGMPSPPVNWRAIVGRPWRDAGLSFEAASARCSVVWRVAQTFFFVRVHTTDHAPTFGCLVSPIQVSLEHSIVN